MKQLIPFNQSTAGSVPLMCLQNTRRGYGIGAKYPTAWEAWLHTQQHPDRNIPAGLDVPLYYSFTHTIDGVRKNYGHINVRLANGRVWSDGKTYASLVAFEQAFSNVKYVGWGESINDVKVIEGNNTMATDAQIDDTINKLHVLAFGKGAPDNVFQNQRPLFKNNYVEANITVLNNYLKVARIPITDDQKYRLIKGMTRRDVTQQEAANREYNENPGMAIDTFWENGGKQGYEDAQNPKPPTGNLPPGTYIKVDNSDIVEVKG